MLNSVHEEVPELYDAQLGAIQQHAVRTDDIPGTGALKGLITLIIYYLKTWEADPDRRGTYNNALQYAKDGIGLLARTNFVGMFEVLPDPDKQRFNNSRAWCTYVLNLSQRANTEDRQVVDRGVRNPDLSRQADELHPFGYGTVKQVGPTRGEWLLGMANTLNGYWSSSKDKLSGSEELQSMGQFGKRHDKVGQNEALKGAILELRKVKHAMPLAEWTDFAIRTHTYISALKRH